MDELMLNHVSRAVALYIKASIKSDVDKMIEIEKALQSPRIANALAGTADDFHNASVNLVKANLYDFAVRLLDLGVRKYPRNADLYADILKYGLECRNVTDLTRYYEGDDEFCGLKNIPKRLWTWRSFSFVLDYLQELLKYYDDQNDNYIVLKKEIESLLSDFYKYAQNFNDQSEQEKAYMAESEYLLLIGETTKAYEVLQKAVEELSGRCPQCALRLADFYFQKADYTNTIKYATIATDSVSTQDAISVGYAFFILAISMERKAQFIDKLTLDEKTCRPIFKAYHKAYVDLQIDNRKTLCQSVQKRVKQLEIETGIKSGIKFTDKDFDLGALAALLDENKE